MFGINQLVGQNIILKIEISAKGKFSAIVLNLKIDLFRYYSVYITNRQWVAQPIRRQLKAPYHHHDSVRNGAFYTAYFKKTGKWTNISPEILI